MRTPCKTSLKTPAHLVGHLCMALFIISGCAAQHLFAVETNPLDVLRIVDGDTIEVAADLGGQHLSMPVRLLYIDTPEARGKHAMTEGEQAKAYLFSEAGLIS